MCGRVDCGAILQAWGEVTMRRLLQQYAKNPSDANARRVAKYVKDHPFSGMLLDAEHWVIMRNAADHMVRLRNQ